jgi:hypothetical protein
MAVTPAALVVALSVLPALPVLLQFLSHFRYDIIEKLGIRVGIRGGIIVIITIRVAGVAGQVG